MNRAADYRKWAEECTGLARTARTPAQRTMLLHIAETWLNLARDAESNSQKAARDSNERSANLN